MLVHDRQAGRAPSARTLLGLVVLATVLFSLVAVLVRPSMYSDSAFGFRVWDAMREGAGFNRMLNADPADIASDIAYFKAAWTPGQYLLPGALEALGLDLGLSLAIVVGLCSALGLWGCYALYRAFGFAPRTCAIALLLVACGRQFTLPFGIYNGGEILLFAAMPWAFLLAWRLRDLRWWSVGPLLAATAVVVFLKLSGVIFMGAAVAAAVPAAGQPLLGRETLRRGIVATVFLGTAALVLRWAWLSHGWSVVQDAARTDWSQLPAAAAFAIANTWAGIFGFGSLAQYVFMFPGRALLSTMTPVDVALVVPAVATAVFMVRRLRGDYPGYVRFAGLVTAAVIAFFVVLLMRGGIITMDERHFRPVSLLLTVGLVEAFLGSTSRMARGLFLALVALAAAYGIASFAQRAATTLRHPLGDRGVRLHAATPALLDYLRTVDRRDPAGGRPLILVPTPEIALEIRHARVLTTHADFQSAEALAAQVHRGRVGRLYVVLDRSTVRSGKADIILRSFADYPRDAWKEVRVGDFTVYESAP